MENVAPEGSDFCNNVVSDSSGVGVVGRLLQSSLQDINNCNVNVTTLASQQQQLHPQQQMSPAKQQQTNDAPDDVVMSSPTPRAVPPSPPARSPSVSPAVLSERPTTVEQQLQSKTLPRAGNSTGQDFKRSSRTPRTQSDPSNMPNKADAAIVTLHQQMMMAQSQPPRHSESTSSLHLQLQLQQKRSQSDLSQVGSTESGYSSLSLNAPSPSHSPTRLSSGDFAAAAVTNTVACGGTSAAAVAIAPGDSDDCGTPSSWQHSEPDDTAAMAAHHFHHRRPVSRSCSVVSSDAASQTDTKSPEFGTPSAVRRKSPEEIECEELSRDLISHLSPSDKLHNILGE